MEYFRAVLTAAVVAATALPAAAEEITGAGSTFVYPLLATWADAYKKETGLGLNYQSIGSGGGIKQITNKTVTFGASDMPLKPEEVAKKGFVQFPIINGADVPIVNLPGIKSGDLTLDGPDFGEDFLRKDCQVERCGHREAQSRHYAAGRADSVVHRSDGSGTTFIWANYLSKVSDEWRTNVGESTAVEWPTGVGAKGNEGVANNTANTSGAIGYVEYAYAKQNKLPYAKMINAAGKAVPANAATFQAAAAGADWTRQRFLRNPDERAG